MTDWVLIAELAELTENARDAAPQTRDVFTEDREIRSCSFFKNESPGLLTSCSTLAANTRRIHRRSGDQELFVFQE